LYSPSLNKAQHVIHFEEWPMDCLVRYLEKKQKFLLTAMAPNIRIEIISRNLRKSNSSAWLPQLDDLFSSSIDGLAIHILMQEQNLFPYVNQLIVASERRLPVNINSFSVVYDYIDGLKKDHSTQKKIFEMINKVFKESRSGNQRAFYPQLFSACQSFEKELFLLLDLQRQVLLPKICRLASQF
jgi:iron-sulfur cluster repair protein YtfE (RIC family)